jgi:hypothetical protein
MTWFKAITGMSVDNITYKPANLSETNQNLVKQTVNAASTQYTITYNGTANGGGSASRLEETAYLNQVIDLTDPVAPTADIEKEGWTFAGWHTDPRAEGVLTSWQVTSDKVLYAIYKKEVTATFISFNGFSQTEQIKKGTIYKENSAAPIEVPELSPYPDWYAKGWVTSADASFGEFSPQLVQTLSIPDNQTFFGLYERQVTLEFNTNGGTPARDNALSSQVTNSSNVSRTWGGQTFLLPEGVRKTNDANFDGWALHSPDGTKYQPGWAFIDLQGAGGATMYAAWDSNTGDEYSIKILAIGNSFSDDGMDFNSGGSSYLFELLSEVGYTDITLGILDSPGCSLQTHWNNAMTENENAYAWHKLTSQSSGVWTTTMNSYNVSMKYGIQNEAWDVIVLQQVSSASHVASTYNSDLDNLVNYVKSNMENPYARLGWQMTWAYGLIGDVPGGGGTLKATPGEQIAMYNGILDAVKKKIVPNQTFDFIIPSGVSIQEMRGYGLGSKLLRDNPSHLSFGLGRYTASMTWLKAITGKAVDSITYKPASVSEADQKMVKQAVNTACMLSATWNPGFEDSVEYLAVHKQDMLSPESVALHGSQSWYVEEPESFTRGWDEILEKIDTKGTRDRRLAVAYTFAYFRHDMSKTIESLQYLMQTAKEKEIPIYIHLDGVMYWRNTGLWNWFNPDVDEELLASDPGAKYDPNNINNVERYGWSKIDETPENSTAVKVAWRDWGEQHRVEQKNGMSVPAPNLASQAFRDANAEALGEILPEIMKWYNMLPDDKKYLLAGVVLGMELSVEMNAFYYKDPGDPIGGNAYWYQPDDTYKVNDLNRKYYPGKKDGIQGVYAARLGYAAAETLGIQSTGSITGETIDYILNDFFDFLIKESLKSGVPAKKLITHAYPPPYDPVPYKNLTFLGTWYEHFSHLRANTPNIDGVIAGWTTPIVSYDGSIVLEDRTFREKYFMPGLGNRPWAAIETHFWALDPNEEDTAQQAQIRRDYINEELPGRLSGIFNHGNCRHVNIKNWEQMRGNEGYLNAIKWTLGQ